MTTPATPETPKKKVAKPAVIKIKKGSELAVSGFVFPKFENLPAVIADAGGEQKLVAFYNRTRKEAALRIGRGQVQAEIRTATQQGEALDEAFVARISPQIQKLVNEFDPKVARTRSQRAKEDRAKLARVASAVNSAPGKTWTSEEIKQLLALQAK